MSKFVTGIMGYVDGRRRDSTASVDDASSGRLSPSTPRLLPAMNLVDSWELTGFRYQGTSSRPLRTLSQRQCGRATRCNAWSILRHSTGRVGVCTYVAGAYPVHRLLRWRSMGVLDEILAWSVSAPIWLRDALRRIVTTPELSDADIAQLAEQCKAPHGLSEQATAPDVLSTHHIPAPPSCGALNIVSITHVSDVNALAPNQTLSF
jgi:hypothetical protein